MVLTSADNFAGILSARVSAERAALAATWLARLEALLPVDVNAVFPSHELLDHIPALIGAIADYLRAPADEEIAANAAVIEKARELGRLRHAQRASVHQLLREYEVLGEILETFVVEETGRLGLNPPAAECFDAMRRITRAVRALSSTTVDTFVAVYSAEIEDRNDRLVTFNRMASHELRTPIGTIVFAAAALEMEGVRANPDQFAKVSSTIRENAERLSRLIDNLQRVTRLGHAVDVPSEQDVDAGSVVAEVERQLAAMAAEREVAIRTSATFPVLSVDPAQLELVLMNLVANAIKYRDPAKPEKYVEISAAPTPQADACTVLVRDNGVGIPRADRMMVFERFFRAHAHRDGELGVSGMGLGLAIVAECVRAMHGSIRCESTEGQGSTFFLTLPCRGSAND